MAGALALAAGILHGQQVSPWWVAVVGVVVAAGLCWPRVAPLLRPVERGYAVAVVLASAGVAHRRHPLRPRHGAAAAAAGRPARSSAASRGGPTGDVGPRSRVERTLAAWPQTIAAIGLPGSRVMSAVVDRWGWRARIGLPPGQTATDLINSVPALESGLRTRPGAVRVEPDPDRADHAIVRVLTTDPHAQPLPYPTQTGDTDRTVTAPIPLGLFEDAEPVTVRLAHRHGLLGGVAGAGKSGVLNVILAELVACPDVVLWGVDLKGGMELRPWVACLDRLATTPRGGHGAARRRRRRSRGPSPAAGRGRIPAVAAHRRGARADRRDRRVRRTRRRVGHRDRARRLRSPDAAGPPP